MLKENERLRLEQLELLKIREALEQEQLLKENERLRLEQLELLKSLEALEQRRNGTSVSGTNGEGRTAVVDGLPSTPTTTIVIDEQQRNRLCMY